MASLSPLGVNRRRLHGTGGLLPRESYCDYVVQCYWVAASLSSPFFETALQILHNLDRIRQNVPKRLISFPAAALSTEPDVVVVLYDSLDKGRVREVPRKNNQPESYIELEGAADLVVEVISDGSVGKDRVQLPPKYAAAGVPELWLVDVRRGLRFELYVLGPEGYRLLAPDAEGWLRSPLIGPVRLRRERKRTDRWSYRLDVGEE